MPMRTSSLERVRPWAYAVLLLSLIANFVQYFGAPPPTCDGCAAPQTVVPEAPLVSVPAPVLLPECANSTTPPTKYERLNGAIVYFSNVGSFEARLNMFSSLKLLDEMFNDRYNYPVYIFYLHTDVIADSADRVKSFVRSNITWVKLTMDIPQDLNASMATALRESSGLGYKHMIQFFTDMVFVHPLLQQYRWLWRLDPDSLLMAPLKQDIFKVMQDNRYIFGYIENQLQCPWDRGLAPMFLAFTEERNITLKWKVLDGAKIFPSKLTGLKGLTKVGVINTHFGVFDCEFFRGPEHMTWAAAVRKEAGIYLHRWGDHHLLTLSSMMFVDIERMHRFNDLAYRHAHTAIRNVFMQIPGIGHTEPRPLRTHNTFDIFENNGVYT
eukprot:TRINITY_DN23013_c0_g1_i1.p1 TRINITY_DN23013_c0_g1~~TRINITY_DN23013_c0_g1_i1.p1  ORF type:complete len:382 (-),score=122.68 TRINITY_DN23013_c0_g1_i1:552-1697(-)